MQSLLFVLTVFVCIYSIAWIKTNGYSFLISLRILIKRLALYVMSFSWIMILATALMIACYSNISGLLKDVLSANSIASLKTIVKLFFGVDSAFAALQMLALYSIMASFVSCLVFAVGMIINIVYLTHLKVSRTTFDGNRQNFEDLDWHWTPTFKLYSKYNS